MINGDFKQHSWGDTFFRILLSHQVYDAAQDKQLSLEEEFQEFAWFLEPRDAAAFVSVQHQATLTYYTEKSSASPPQWNQSAKGFEATVPTSSWDVENTGYLAEDEAIVPDDLEDSYINQSDEHMYGAVADAFSVLKSGVQGLAKGSNGYEQCESCYPCRAGDAKLVRMFSDESGYGSHYEEELGVV